MCVILILWLPPCLYRLLLRDMQGKVSCDCLQERVRGGAYDGLVDELLAALKARYGPQVLIHWEDFGAGNAFRLLAKYQEQVGCADGLRSHFGGPKGCHCHRLCCAGGMLAALLSFDAHVCGTISPFLAPGGKVLKDSSRKSPARNNETLLTACRWCQARPASMIFSSSLQNAGMLGMW